MADPVDSTSTTSTLPESQADPMALRDASGVSTREPSASAKSQSGWRNSVAPYFELIRFSHTVFALPFALLACSLALVSPGLPIQNLAVISLRVFAVLLCMVFARSAAMAFNRLVDAEFDAKNPRTANRHLATGQLRRKQVWGFFMLNSLAFIASCSLFLPNWLPLVCSVPVLFLICGYSYAKRFTSAAHLWLGAALALSPICTWVAIRGEAVMLMPSDLLPAICLALAIAFWVAGFDIIYACQDADFDRQAGLHSIPAKFGVAGALRIAACLHAAMLIVLAMLPLLFPQLSLGWLYLLTLAAVAGLILWQHAIVRPNDLRRVGEAFFNINAIISLGLCTMTAIDAIWR
ncbi:MAG: putative 4-hydroxybenzoate polyprenyltransferase [bacterium]|nr:putative 4-hydroxybenzoate polyprenyltransferase [bacterium]